MVTCSELRKLFSGLAWAKWSRNVEWIRFFWIIILLPGPFLWHTVQFPRFSMFPKGQYFPTDLYLNDYCIIFSYCTFLDRGLYVYIPECAHKNFVFQFNFFHDFGNKGSTGEQRREQCKYCVPTSNDELWNAHFIQKLWDISKAKDNMDYRMPFYSPIRDQFYNIYLAVFPGPDECFGCFTLILSSGQT